MLLSSQYTLERVVRLQRDTAAKLYFRGRNRHEQNLLCLRGHYLCATNGLYDGCSVFQCFH